MKTYIHYCKSIMSLQVYMKKISFIFFEMQNLFLGELFISSYKKIKCYLRLRGLGLIPSDV